MWRILGLRRTLAAIFVLGTVSACAGYLAHYGRLLAAVSRQEDAVAALRGGEIPHFAVIDAAGRLTPLSSVLDASPSELHAIALVRPGCPRCEVASARLRALQQRHRDSLSILAIDVREASSGEGPGEGASAVLRDAEGAFARVFQGVVTPIVLLVGRDGRVEEAWSRVPDPQALEAAYERALGRHSS